MKTRSGQMPIVFEDDSTATRRLVLLGEHIRTGGGDEPHICCVCLGTLRIVGDAHPSWVQCPKCLNVLHEPCLMKWIAHKDDRFDCPHCKATFSRDAFENDPDSWNADAVVETLLSTEDADYEPPPVVSSNIAYVVKSHRSSRSRGDPPTQRRRLRSDGGVNDY